MTEPRARPRQKGQVFSTTDLQELLYAFGSNPTPTGTQLPSTVSVLDEILTDFIIETCHGAALCASYSRRQKIKVDDFKWVLRKDERLLGRVLEQLWKDKSIREERKTVDVNNMGNELAAGLQDIAEVSGLGEEVKGKKGRKKKRKAEEEMGGEAKRRVEPNA